MLLFWIKLVTFEPITAVIEVVPEPAPVLVTVPALFILFVVKVIVPVVALLFIVRLFVPVIPPEKVVEIAVPVLPKLRVPEVVEANTIALLYVSPVTLISKVALFEPPLLSPNVIDPVPKAFADDEPAVIVPALITDPPV